MIMHIVFGVLTLALIAGAAWGFIGVKAPNYEAPRYALICTGLVLFSFFAWLATE